MNKYYILILTVVLSCEAFSQKVRFSFDAGINFSSFAIPNNVVKTQSAEVLVNSTEGYTVVNSISEKIFSQKGSSGFLISGNVAYPVNNYLSLIAGVGITVHNTKLKIKIKTFLPEVDNSQFYYVLVSSSGISEFTSLTVGSDNSIGDLRYSQYYTFVLVDSPVRIQTRLFAERLLVSAGVTFSRIILAERTVSSKSSFSPNTEKVNDNFEKFIFQPSAGIKFKVLPKFYLGADYSYNATNLFLSGTDEENIKLRSGVVSLTYQF